MTKIFNHGKLRETLGEIEIEWRIPEFFSATNKADDYIFSPAFSFSSSYWYLLIYPFGRNNISTEHIGLFLMKADSGGEISVNVSLQIASANKENPITHTYTKVFGKKFSLVGYSRFMTQLHLLERKSEFAPLDVVTVICSMKLQDQQELENSAFQRMKNVCFNLRDIYNKKKQTDILLNVEGERIPAHKMILETRSPVFSAMFRHNMKENQTGEVDIKDIDPKTFQSVLFYLYCGELDCALSTEKALAVYVAADRYDIPELKQLCVLFIKQNLCEQWVCNVIEFADLYHEEDIAQCARTYFKENVLKVIETEGWRKFAKENHESSTDLLESALKELSLKNAGSDTRQQI